MNKEKLIEQIKKHEGLRLKPYKCSENKLTIGYGRNLEANGISNCEANMMLANDIHKYIKQVEDNIPFFYELNDARQNVLVNMSFNLGIYGLLKFKKFLKYLNSEDYIIASKEMLDSRWAKQVGSRAIELSEQIRTGEF